MVRFLVVFGMVVQTFLQRSIKFSKCVLRGSNLHIAGQYVGDGTPYQTVGAHGVALLVPTFRPGLPTLSQGLEPWDSDLQVQIPTSRCAGKKRNITV